MEFTCNSIAYNRMESLGCLSEGSCDEKQFKLNDRCFDNDRNLDYIRCYHKHDCGADSKAICDVIGCDNVICDFDSTEVVQMLHQCRHCDDQSNIEPNTEIAAVPSGRSSADYLEFESTSQSSNAKSLSDTGNVEPVGVKARESLSEKWKSLSSQKQKLIGDFILPGAHSLTHQDGTEAAFEAVASDFTKRDFKKRALIDLPQLTSYEDVCCSRDEYKFPDVITPEFVIAEFVKQTNFSHVTCENEECGPPPST